MATAELFVHPTHRGGGIGRILAEAVALAATDADPTGRFRIWAHGDQPAAARLARSMGLRRTRTLLRMQRPLIDDIPAAQFPSGVQLRSFHPGQDEQAWLELNARAFADHPEQGSWTMADLRHRKAEPWFDPTGFLLAVGPATARADAIASHDGGELLGFHWTKIHSGTDPGGTDPGGTDPGGTDPGGTDPGGEARVEPVGEVYVLGVDPAAHRMRLGTALTLAGLRLLRDRGLREAMLFADESNGPAVRLYERLGFRRATADVTYEADGRRPPAADR